MLTRIWPALAAWGAGLLHLAVAAGCPPPVLLALAALGLAELAWGAVVLHRGRLVMPRVVLGAAVAGVLVSTAVALGGGMGLIPLAAIIALLLYIAAAAGLVLRDIAKGRPGRRSRPLVGLLLGACMVAAITTPALALTGPGELAVPHGELSGHHGH
ncbi:hypothetical protein [Microbacterium marinilacus]|uniref:Uncharacterized protein n=1 Tax=Microbacterium marinilacus TaxID=415209 RepID=A0ABP7B1Y0_9MICO|nr:hypothetical protein [Microbacterium marinilacus]MBY0688579.1 hypothetical protein [Microbacterium marinilacus]